MKKIQQSPIYTQLALTLVIALFSILSLKAQVWEKFYNFAGTGNVEDIIPTIDNGFIAIGSSKDLIGPNDSLHVTKLDEDGDLQWKKFYSVLVAPHLSGRRINSTADGGYILSGENHSTTEEVHLVKIDNAGNQEWAQTYTQFDQVFGDILIVQAPDGGYLLSYGNKDDNLNLIKLNSTGVLEWQYIHTTAEYDYPHEIIIHPNNTYSVIGDFDFLSGNGGIGLLTVDSIGNLLQVKTYNEPDRQRVKAAITTLDGGMLLAGTHWSQTNTAIDSSDVWMIKTDAAGNELWSKTIPRPNSSICLNVTQLLDSTFVFTGEIVTGGFPYYGFVTKTDALGNFLWENRFPYSQFSGITVSNDGFIVLGGMKSLDAPNNLGSEHYIKMATTGQVYQSYLLGNVAHDASLDCIIDPAEPKLQNWILEATGANTHYAITDTLGNYRINLDSGNYDLKLFSPNNLWLPCQSSYALYVGATDTVSTDVPVKSVENCVYLTTDISTPLLRRCFDNNYTVSFCNEGTIPSPNSYLEIEFDPYLIVNSSSLPWTSQVGNLYTFWVGNLDINECGSFVVNVTVDCDSTILGQTHCVEAHIYPDSICVPFGIGWDGSITSLDVICEADSVTFIIANTGLNAMSTQMEYSIIEDNIIMRQDFFQLNAGETLPIKVPSNGSTYRMYAGQAPGYFPSSYHPTIALEGCGVDPITGLFSTGFITAFSEDDVLDYISIDCQENIGSYDPNDKGAEPKGFSAAHYIEVGDDLEYHIRFQNTGTDTAFTVMIRDTLSEFLKVNSLVPGSSSHPYDFEIINGNTLKFKFNDILLVDSTTNEPDSHGFVKFKIKQEDNLPLGTKIYNSAAIYFDFNAPIITNETFHEIGENFIEVISSNKDLPDYPDFAITVQPNPFVDHASFVLENAPSDEKTFRLYNATGVLLKEAYFSSDSYQFTRNNLNVGMFFYTIHLGPQLLGSGKVVVH